MEFMSEFVAGLFAIGVEGLTGLGSLFTAAIGVMYAGTPAVITPIGWVVTGVIGIPLGANVLTWLLSQLKKIKPAPGSAKK